MQRKLQHFLDNWYSSTERKPLLVRGARQVGKSHLIREFSKRFEYFVEINFDMDKTANIFFPDTINVEKICEKLSYYKETPVIPGKTLIFLDEIQDCPNALKALRYFKELMPELHIIAAGSFLEFLIEKIGVPVGRVEFMHVYPMSFLEYLDAVGESILHDSIVNNKLIDVLHNKLLEHYKVYTLIGGMPEVVHSYVKHKDLLRCQKIQSDIINAYLQDFNKYAKTKQIDNLNIIIDRIPNVIGNKLVLTKFDAPMSAYNVKQCINLLKMAGLIYQCTHTSAQSLPLSAGKKHNKYKLYFLDVGLLQNMLGVKLKDWIVEDAFAAHRGLIAEQFVAGELMAYSDESKFSELFYWHREARSSNAEVDFVIEIDGKVIPIEVKSGDKGHLKSMQLFLQSHSKTPYGVRLSSAFLSEHNLVKSIPIYALYSLISSCY